MAFCFCCARETDGKAVFPVKKGKTMRLAPVCSECCILHHSGSIDLNEVAHEKEGQKEEKDKQRDEFVLAAAYRKAGQHKDRRKKRKKDERFELEQES